MNKDIFSKLDLNDYLDEYKNFLARQKQIILQGDRNIHFKMINLLQNYELKNLPQVQNLEIQLTHLKKLGILRIQEIYEFIKIINYFLYLKKIDFKDELENWINKIIIPNQINEILHYFDEKGNINFDIDERFIQIQNKIKIIKEKISVIFKQILYNKKLEAYLIDHQIHYINEQECLLVRGGYNHVIKGTLCARSTSGHFYVAPEKINELKNQESKLNDEYEIILYEYSKKISEVFYKNLLFLKFINNEFDRFDSYYSRVSFAKSKDYEFILPKENKAIKLISFAHPALKEPVLINLDFNKKISIITGVNAGGKTMLLKSILTAALLAKYLLPFKINPNSQIGSFKLIKAIIEDPQNAKNDISTFAGRMLAFSKIIKQNDMILGVDEIELGTDANEAASLFKNIIKFLIKKDVKMIITTHHKRLASMLANHDEVELIAALYDEKKQEPSFQFLKGTIGKSYAFETALRYGIPKKIIHFAKQDYGKDLEKLNVLIEKNVALEYELKTKLNEIELQKKHIEKEKLFLENEKEQTNFTFQKRQHELELDYFEAINAAKKAIKANNIKEKHQELNKANLAKKEIKQKLPNEPKNFKVGDWVKYSNTRGVIISIKNDIAKLSCEGINLQVPLSYLLASSKPKTPKSKVSIIKEKRGNIKLDLHGQRVEEALENLEQFISDAIIEGFEEILVYHGIGSGKLANAVKSFLKTYPKKLEFYDAPTKLGGFGATIIKL